MANYSYIHLPKVPTKDGFANALAGAVKRTLGDAWAVQLAEFQDGGPTWLVTLPGTAVPQPEANKRMVAPNQDMGFTVTLHTKTIAFRHTPNHFERWAQGCAREELADFFGSASFFDSTDRNVVPSAREYRQGKTFREYLTRNFDRPLTPDEEIWIARFKDYAPEGFW